MYSSKPHINLLTSALHAYGIEHIIVCAGARNGILVHNFNASGHFTLHSAVDERSAAFMSIGMTLATGTPTCVCVTSGSALLGCLPAVTEAYYRQIPILILSADRPAEWIDRLDGQTIHQVDALAPYAKTWNIEEAFSANEKLLHEALSTLNEKPGRPVHINIPISEPLFTLSEQALPAFERTNKERCICTNNAPMLSSDIISRINAAKLPILVIGQYEEAVCLFLEEIEAKGKLLVLPELLANCKMSWRTAVLEKCLNTMQNDGHAEGFHPPHPDLIIHIGLNSVHKRLRTYLRSLHCPVIRISENGDAIDTFSASSFLSVKSPLTLALQQMSKLIRPHAEVKKWQARLDALHNQSGSKDSSLCLYTEAERSECAEKLSMASVLQKLSFFLNSSPTKKFTLHLANSSILREACHFFDGGDYPIHCNRGTNGIEGSVSAATGYAIATPSQRSLLLTGDLSFLYDQNGLWSSELNGNLRIMLFNDGGGGIFHHMPALENISERYSFISAPHSYSAKGTTETFNLTYLSVESGKDLFALIEQWWYISSSRPVILEIFTSR